MPSFKPIQEITITGGGTVNIDLTSYVDTYYIKGTATLASAYEIAGTGTPYNGMRVRFEYNATITTSANTITFLGTAMPQDYAAKKVNIDCYYNGSAWVVDYQPAFDEIDIITTGHIKAANVTLAKLEAVTAGSIVMGNASNRPTITAITGDIALTNAGVSSIAAGVIVDADINASAAVATSKLAAAADIAKLATVTKAELDYNAGVTAGTAAASKAVVLSATKKIDEIDPTVLKINGQTVTASGTELSQLNSAGVLKADFDELEGLAAAGIVKADLALLAGAATAGVTAADIQGIAADTAQRVQTKTATVITDATVDESTGLICLTLTADTNLTLPDGSVNSKQVIDIIIVANAASAYDVTFLDTGATFLYAGTSASDSMKITAPPPGSLIKLVNSAVNTWVIGTAAT